MARFLDNNKRITLVSFLAYFVMSGMLAPIGIISGPMAELFGETITDVTARFSWLTIGNLIGAVIAVFLFEWVPLKIVMILVYASILTSLLSLNIVSDLSLVGPALGIVGVGCGLGLVGAALIISRCYQAERRASMLIITDGCFSVAGFMCAGIAAFLIVREFHWASVYQFVGIVVTVIVLLCAFSRFPTTLPSEQETTVNLRWPLSIWCCLGALFLYTLGQFSMLWWLPNYVETTLHVGTEQAGRLVSLFWFGLFAAQIFVAWWVIRVGVRRLVLIAAVATTFFSIPLWIVEDIASLSILAFIWGFANLSLLKVVLSFATEMLAIPSARLVSSLLLGATVGTAISPWVTSQIVVVTNNYFILQFSTICYASLTVLLFAATRLFRV